MQPWDTALPDWETRLLAGQPLVPDLPLFRDEADRALRIFKRLKLPDVVGTPRLGDAAGEWIFRIVEALFGSYDPETNRRMIQELFLLVPKKNSKTSSAAAIMVVAIIMNRRPNAEFLLIAPTKQIADISFKQAVGIIKADPELTKLFKPPQAHIRTITHHQSGATIQVKAADTDAITGSKSTGILVDETHVFAKKGNAADIFVEIRGALAARPDGFMIQISTQSKEPPSGVFKSELRTAREVRDGKMSLPRLAVLYELPERMQKDGGWKDRKTWGLVNPNMGRSVDERFLENELTTAEREGPAQLALFASQHFNVEVGLGLRTDRWAGADFWLRRADKTLTLESLLARCDVAVVGIDGGGLDDLLGLCVMGREKGTRRWLVWCRAWAKRIVLERRKEIAPRILDFVKEGSVYVIADDSDEDIEAVADIVEQVNDAGILAAKKAIGVDPVGIAQVLDELELRGFPATDRVEGVRQGWTMSDKIKTCERRLAAGELIHDGSDLMTWCVGNAKVEPRGNAISITKAVSGSAKIDPLMAVFNAADIMATNPTAGSSGRLGDFLKSPLAA